MEMNIYIWESKLPHRYLYECILDGKFQSGGSLHREGNWSAVAKELIATESHGSAKVRVWINSGNFNEYKP